MERNTLCIMVFQRSVPCFAAVNAGFPLSSCCDFNSTTGPHIVSRLLHSSCESELTLTLSVCLSTSFCLPFSHTDSLLRNNSWLCIRASTFTPKQLQKQIDTVVYSFYGLYLRNGCFNNGLDQPSSIPLWSACHCFLLNLSHSQSIKHCSGNEKEILSRVYSMTVFISHQTEWEFTMLHGTICYVNTWGPSPPFVQGTSHIQCPFKASHSATILVMPLGCYFQCGQWAYKYSYQMGKTESYKNWNEISQQWYHKF